MITISWTRREHRRGWGTYLTRLTLPFRSPRIAKEWLRMLQATNADDIRIEVS